MEQNNLSNSYMVYISKSDVKEYPRLRNHPLFVILNDRVEMSVLRMTAG